MMTLTRDQQLKRYRTYIWASGIKLPTFDLDRCYTEMPTREIIALRDKTVQDLERNPNFATKFYSEFVEYLNGKLAERRTLRDWFWRNIVLKIDITVLKLRYDYTTTTRSR
jgi:hypothetical protein